MEKSTKVLDKKLLNYLGASAAVLASGAASGQVVYTDVTPDAVATGINQGFYIDLNNDATNDFTVAVAGSSGVVNAAVAVPYATGSSCAGGNAANEVMGSMPSNYNYASKLAANDPIAAAGPWLGTNCVQGTMGYYQVGNGSPYNEEWNNGVTDGYLGFKFESGGSIYYGWARLDVSADNLTLTLKDYAYESTAGTQILAGDMGASSVGEISADQVGIYSNDNIVKVKIDESLSNGSIQIVSTSGQIVKEDVVSNGTQEFILNDIAAGLYIVNVTFNEGVISKKITIN